MKDILPSDKPVLYFNYLLQTDSNDYIPGVRSMSDAMRVYVGDGTNWVLAATNDSYRGALTGDDEQDLGPNGVTSFPNGQLFPDVVELYDEAGTPQWRQARVDLSNFAGRSDLRLRFEFDTSGAVNVGDISTVGEEMYAREGSKLRDGQSYILEGVNQFELDMGYTLVAPSFSGLVEGETFTLDVDTETLTFEIDLQQSNGSYNGVAGANNAIRISRTMSANEIARAIDLALRTAIAATPVGSPLKEIKPHTDGNRVNIARQPDNAPITTIGTTLTQNGGAGLFVDGAPGVTPGTTPVVIHSGMSRNEVALAMKNALAGHLLPAGAYYEVEGNNAADPLIATDLEALSWTDVANNTIQENNAAPLPHISIIGSSSGIFTDFYRFDVPAGALTRRVIVDLDGTNTTFNSMIRIVDTNGATVIENLVGSTLDIGSNHITSYIDTNLAPGEYYVQIGVPPFANDALPGERYTLHLSVEGHAVNANGPADPLVVNPFNIKTSGDLVRIIAHYVTNPGPMGHTTALPGDGFGGYYDTATLAQRGMNNAFEGMYIDDIIIGFAERGEMVTNAPSNSAFIDNPQIVNRNNTNPYPDILEGAYDVEIRRASDYASTPSSVPNPQFDSRDTNDRLTDAQSIRVPNAASLRDGQTFTISDGVNSVTFEYEDELLSNGVAQGHFAILFNPAKAAALDGRYEMGNYRTGESSATIAGRILDAINSTSVQGILKIRASLSDGAEDSAFGSTSSVINLYGTALVTLNDGLQKPGADGMPDGFFGTMAGLGNTAGSSTLFTFRNTTPYLDPNTGYPEQIHSIRIQLPAGQKFDPISILGGNGTGPTVNAASDFDSPTFTSLDNNNPRIPKFTFSSEFDVLTIDFSQIVDAAQRGPGFEKNDVLIFGLDIDFFAEPVWNLGATVDVSYSSGRAVASKFVQSGTTDQMGVLRPVEDPTTVISHEGYGDSNQYRDQGQLLIRSNFISDSLNWGILSDAGARTGSPNPTGAGALSHSGPPRNLREPNTNNWLPGIVISNNVIVQSGQGGILFSGEIPPGSQSSVGPVPVGRIINNTIVGNPTNRVGVGIQVEQNASPTLLNNIVADLVTGISVDAGSQTLGTVVGGTLYRNNGTNAATGSIGLGTFPISLTNTDPLFVDQARRNYYPAPLSQAIDSSIDTLSDRTGFITVRDPLGIGVSPITTPTVDAYGQLRGDDPAVSTPAAQGANVFKDRGAIDRVDFFRPTAYFSTPLDQSTGDLDTTLDAVWLNSPITVRELIISLSDIGIGIDDARVLLNGSQFKLYMDDGVKQATDLPDLPNGTVITEGLMQNGVDYVFVYNSTTNEVIFRSTTSFPDERKYRITVDNDDATSDGVDGIRDLAGNYLSPNRVDGTTQFTLLLTDGINDAPVNSVPLVQTTAEDTTKVFSVANGNLISVSDADVWLGTNTLRVTLVSTNGVMSLSRVTGLTFTAGDGTADATMTFTGTVDFINAALAGMSFIPAQDYFGPAQITITTNDLGGFTGPPTPPAAPQEDIDVIPINVTPVNDIPVFNPLTDPAAVNEDAGAQTVLGFMTGQAAGPANETPPQTITATLTVTAVTGAWTTANFFSTAPAIDTTTGDLTYTTAPDVNGTATISVVLTDSLGAQSVVRTFTISVNAINDEPVYTLNPVLPISVAEDAGTQNVDLVNTFAAAIATALDELGSQNLTWILSNVQLVSGNLSMDTLTIDSNGNLTFKSHQDTAGVISVDLTLQDDGATGGLNDNATTPFTLQITVNQVNDAPVAVALSHTVDRSYDLTLDASLSYDVDAFFGQTLTYAWDLDNNGTFETSTAGNAVSTVTWAYLQSLGISAPETRTIRLRVTDSSGAVNNTGTTTATLNTLIVDYGDTPDTFGTLKATNGAAHTISGGLFLGSSVDDETTGVPSADASGDGADEDGVNFPTRLETTSSQALPAFVDIIASKAGFVDAWLDLNQNGVFDAGERLTLPGGMAVVAGSNRLFFDIPANTLTGDTFMRFRISSTGGLAPTGRAADGEVEDYPVKIRTLSAPVTPVINRPVDFNLADGRIPQTSDLTPVIVWTSHQENYSYSVEVRNAANTLVYSGTTTFSLQEVTNTLPSGIYTATVVASNKLGTTAAPAIWTFEVVPLVVAAPSGNVTVPRPVIQWNAIEGSSKYTVNIESLTAGNTFLLTTFSTTGLATPNQFIPTTDLPIGRYQVRVRATDAADQLGDWSPFVTFQVKTAPVVTSPAGPTTSIRPAIAWTSVAGAVTYEVDLFNLTDNVQVAKVTGITTTSWTPAGNLTLADYRVRVRAFNVVNEDSNWSSDQVFRVAPVPVAVAPIGRVADATPTFSWNGIAAADRYELVVTQNFGSHVQVINEVNLTSTSFTQPTDLPLGRYQFTIRAVNMPAAGSGTGPAFSTISSTYDFTVTERPSVTAPLPTTFLARPTVEWTNPLGAGANPVSEVWLNKVENGVSSKILSQPGIAGTSWQISTDLVLGTYQVWVRTTSSVDPGTVSDWSIARTFRVTTPPNLIGPTGRVTDATPTLTWEGVPGAQSYRVFVSSNSVNTTVYDVSNINALNFTIPSDLPIGRYRYWVQARSAFGDLSNWSAPKDFQIVTGPTLTGPSSSTFDTTPSFAWTNMATTLNGLPAGATSYEFRIDQVLSTSVMTNFRFVAGLTSPNYTLPAADSLPVGNYRAYVRARSADTQGDFSFALAFFVGGRPIVNSVPTSSNQTPRITWQAVDGSSGYEVYIVNVANPSVILVRQSNIGATNFTPATALGKGTFRVWVRAFNASTGAASLWSNAVDFTITSREESALPASPDTWMLTALAPAFDDGSVDTTISMLPSRMSGAVHAMITESPVVETEQALMIPEPGTSQQTDAVLGGWDNEAWWDVPTAEAVEVAEQVVENVPVVEAVPVKEESKSAAVGLLGALLALSPLRRRRRNGEESST
ncbi:MAG: GEVED domain-containing protein [Planctomycetaceae bacterium]